MPYISPAYIVDPQRKPRFPCAVDWNHPISRGLVGCWLFNEGSGKNCYDLRNNTSYSHLAYNGGTLSLVNDMLFFPTIDGRSYIGGSNIDPFQIDGNDPMTIVWSGILSLTMPQYYPIIGNLSSAANNPGFYMRINYGVGSLLPSLFIQDNSGGYIGVSSDVAAAQAVLNTIVMRYTGGRSGNNVLFYQNNVLVNSTVQTNTLSASSLSNSPLQIGAVGFDVSVFDYLGYMNYLYIFNRALTASEIQQLYIEPYAFIRPVIPMPFYISTAAPPAGIPTHMDYYRRMRMR